MKDPEPEMTSTRRVADGARSGGGGDRVAGGRAQSEEVNRSLGAGRGQEARLGPIQGQGGPIPRT